MKDGEHDSKTFPDCPLLSETVIYKYIHEKTFFCDGALRKKAQYSQCHLQRRSKCMSLA